jgi:hypothetical protein
MHLDTGREIVNIDGVQVEKNVLDIIEKLQEYDENLQVFYLDPSRVDADFADAPWLIAEKCKDGKFRKVFTCWELNDSVLERVWKADNQKHNVGALLEKNNEDVRAEIRRRYEEVRAEARDIVEHVLRSPKGRYSFPSTTGETVTLDDHVGVISRVGEPDHSRNDHSEGAA